VFIYIYKHLLTYLFNNLVTLQNANMSVMKENALIMIYVIVIKQILKENIAMNI